MATNVLLIDEDAFHKHMEERRQHYAALAKTAAADKNFYDSTFNAAVAMSIIEVAKSILHCSKIEKWD